MRKFSSQIVKKIEKNCIAFFWIKSFSRLFHRDWEYFERMVEYENGPLDIQIREKEGKAGNILYIIHEQGHNYGFFSEMIATLNLLIYADDRGLIPYIYWGSDFLYYDNSIQIENGFEYYFDQKTTRDEAETIRFVSNSKDIQSEYIEKKYCVIKNYYTSAEFDRKRAEVLGKYIEIKKDLQTEFDDEFKHMFSGNRVLGIHYRGTDFNVGYVNHAAAVTEMQIEEQINKAFERNEFDIIFLATDDQEVLDRLIQKYGEKIQYFTDTYRTTGDVSVAFSNESRRNHKYLLGKEVLRDAYILSQCNGFIGGLSRVSTCARLLKMSRNETYKYEYIINNGINECGKGFQIS